MKVTIAVFLGLASLAVANPIYDIAIQVPSVAADDVHHTDTHILTQEGCLRSCWLVKPDCPQNFVSSSSFQLPFYLLKQGKTNRGLSILSTGEA